MEDIVETKQKRDWFGYGFTFIYIILALAMFRHTTIGFASIETPLTGRTSSYIWGGLAAFSIDVSMIWAATVIRRRTRDRVWAGILLLITGIASAFAQLFYSITHAASVPVSEGAQWMDLYAVLLISWRVVIFPLLLPSMAFLNAMAAKPSSQESDMSVTETGQKAGQLYDYSDFVVKVQDRSREEVTAMSPKVIAERARVTPRTARRWKADRLVELGVENT